MSPFVPKIGDALFIGKPLRSWVAVRELPYTRKDGEVSKILVWETNCRTCGNPFEVTSGARFVVPSNAFDIVNCPAHRGVKRVAV